MELTKKSVYDDIEVELTHAGDDRLASLCIGCNTECGILFSKLCKSLAHLVLTCFGLGLDSDIDNGLRELHRLKDNGISLITESITCCGKLKTYRSGDITRVNLLELHSLVCMHLKDTSDTFLLVF